jgi:hypothetical protein
MEVELYKEQKLLYALLNQILFPRRRITTIHFSPDTTGSTQHHPTD